MLYQSEILRELHSFAAFCREKPADETYEFNNSQNCACAQYLKHRGTFRYDWAFPGRIMEQFGVALLNALASTATGGWCLPTARWGDLLKLVEAEIDRELARAGKD